jgi:hypothetical protein
MGTLVDWALHRHFDKQGERVGKPMAKATLSLAGALFLFTMSTAAFASGSGTRSDPWLREPPSGQLKGCGFVRVGKHQCLSRLQQVCEPSDSEKARAEKEKREAKRPPRTCE